MKNIILSLVILLTFNTTAQDSYEPLILIEPSAPIELNINSSKSSSSYGNESNMPIGVGMMLGGATFIVAGLLTPPSYVGGSTTERKPFFQQAKIWPILSGALVFTGGIVISIGG